MLNDLLESICGGVSPLPPSASPKCPPSDSKLAAEHDSLFALASAVASAASAGRGAVGEFPWPFYFIGTRDCFSYNLIVRSEVRLFLGSIGLYLQGYLQRSSQVNSVQSAISQDCCFFDLDTCIDSQESPS